MPEAPTAAHRRGTRRGDEQAACMLHVVPCSHRAAASVRTPTRAITCLVVAASRTAADEPEQHFVRHLLVQPVVIDQRRPGGTEPHRFDGAEQHVVRGHRLDLDGAAVERDHRGGQHRRAGFQRDPFADGETLFEMHAASARKQIGELLFVGAQRIDAEHAVLGEQRRALGAAVEANQQRRRLIGHRANGGRGKSGFAARARRGDHVHGGAEPAHRVAERRHIDAVDRRLRRDRRKGAVHGVVGPLVDPAHCGKPCGPNPTVVGPILLRRERLG